MEFKENTLTDAIRVVIAVVLHRRAVCVALGLPMMTPRIARAYSVWMLMYGYKEHATLGDVQDFLGHDDPHSTKIYLDMIDDFDSRKERYQRIVQSGEIEGTRVLKPNLEAKF